MVTARFIPVLVEISPKIKSPKSHSKRTRIRLFKSILHAHLIAASDVVPAWFYFVFLCILILLFYHF